MTILARVLVVIGAGLMLVAAILLSAFFREDGDKITLTAAVIVGALGLAALWFSKRMLGTRESPYGSDARTYSFVLIVAQPTEDSSFFEQIKDKLVATVAARPRFPLAPDATIATVYGSEMPEPTGSAMQGFVWAMQTKFNRDRGGGWQADFHEYLGREFVVIYMQ